MKAALLHRFGEPLELAEVPRPEPGPGQVLVRVEACGVCHSDLHVARGEWEGFKPRMRLPVILGHEVVGRVAKLGDGVESHRIGDRVGVPWFHSTCGACEACARGREVFCSASEITGVTVDGGFAEYLVAWASHALPIPDGLAPEAAAPLFCAGGTVWSALAKVALEASSRLGVWGAGGLGQYAVQLGKRAGAHVTAVDLGVAKLDAARALGADAAVEAAGAVEWFAHPARRLDVAIVCAASVEAYRAAFRCLRGDGVLLVVGIPGEPLAWTAGELIRSGVRVVPSRVASRREIQDLLAAAARGEVRSEVRACGLGEVNQVLDLLQRGEMAGRAVVVTR
jgi:propanol-preferring alcohol dehydrogenase